MIEKTWECLGLIEEGQALPSYLYIKKLDIVSLMIREDLFWSRTELVNQAETIVYMGGLCKKFKNNNLLHNHVFELLKLITHLAEECESLWSQVFNNKPFLLFCI